MFTNDQTRISRLSEILADVIEKRTHDADEAMEWFTIITVPASSKTELHMAKEDGEMNRFMVGEYVSYDQFRDDADYIIGQVILNFNISTIFMRIRNLSA